MSVTYTWKVTGLKARDEGGHTNAVVQTYWQKIGTDENGNQGTFSGATPFSAANVPAGQFVPYEELTEEIVLGWIQSVVVGSYEEHVNGQIQKQIDAIVNPIVDPGLPWAPAPAPEPAPAPTPEPAPAPAANTTSPLTPEE
jgi:hypothetical protein